MIANYWCETCKGKYLGKNIRSVFLHLKHTHNIKVMTRASYVRREHKGLRCNYYCNVCGELLGHVVFRVSDRVYISHVSQNRIKTHMRQHPKFECDGHYLRTIRAVLNYIDEQHDIHIGFVKGLTKRKVFLDGITT